MSFLEFVLTNYLGKPRGSGRDAGVSYWSCPRCVSDSFRTLPVDPRYPKQKAKCWSCKWTPDAADLIAHFNPQMRDYSDRIHELAHLQHEYKTNAFVMAHGV